MTRSLIAHAVDARCRPSTSPGGHRFEAVMVFE